MGLTPLTWKLRRSRQRLPILPEPLAEITAAHRRVDALQESNEVSDLASHHGICRSDLPQTRVGFLVHQSRKQFRAIFRARFRGVRRNDPRRRMIELSRKTRHPSCVLEARRIHGQPSRVLTTPYLHPFVDKVEEFVMERAPHVGVV